MPVRVILLFYHCFIYTFRHIIPNLTRMQKATLATWQFCHFAQVSKGLRLERVGGDGCVENVRQTMQISDEEGDIIDEALQYFKPNIFFRQYDINGSADRTLIYLFLYITECLKRLNKVRLSKNFRTKKRQLQRPKRSQAIKELTTMALESDLPIPGESAFPFAGIFKPPANAQEEGESSWHSLPLFAMLSTGFSEIMRAYLQQLRHELGGRLIERVYGGSDEPSKVCFKDTF